MSVGEEGLKKQWPGKALSSRSAAQSEGHCWSFRKVGRGPRVSLPHPVTWSVSTSLAADQGLDSVARQRTLGLSLCCLRECVCVCVCMRAHVCGVRVHTCTGVLAHL